ncbi:MAG: ATP-binding protein [Candidatus Omnitrophica bacterium]|nr:ATP-binding protein [Candidatus Omnitrophota bacterium]
MVTTQMKSETDSIRHASADIVNFILSKKKDAHRDILFDIKLCVEEAVRNAIVHGNKSEPNLPVDISYDIADNKIIIVVEDRGTGFHPANLPDPTHADNLFKESGRGVYLMYKLMDKVHYNARGNSVTMEKALA